MSNATARKLVGGLGTVLILVICGVLIGAHFLTERNLQKIDVSSYVDIKRDGSAGYTFELNVERMLYTEHLIDPPEAEADRYPEIKALKTLGVRATEQDGQYVFETVSTSTDTHFNETLKKGGLKLVNTQWTWTKEQVSEKLGEQRGSVIKLRYPDYIVTKQNAEGSFSASLDIVRLMRDAHVDPNADPETDAGLRAMNSLGIACTKNADAWLLQATSTSETITDDLREAGLQIAETQWTWTDAEMQAHLGAAETPTPTEAPTETPTSASRFRRRRINRNVPRMRLRRSTDSTRRSSEKRSVPRRRATTAVALRTVTSNTTTLPWGMTRQSTRMYFA